jgi:hypothetical protein
MFPFDQPPATALYLGLYLLTLVLHVLSMNYVLAGQSYLAVVGALEVVRGPLRSQAAPAAKLRDWLPFALGVTITAGVAPLLFVQILYKRPFYTANLLLFHRWMAILPVLIGAFYLLYLRKSKRWPTWSASARAGISIGIWGAFGFVAWSWTENHLLSLADQSRWTAEYVSDKWFFTTAEHLPRLMVWFFGGFPVLATALGWQLRHDRLRQERHHHGQLHHELLGKAHSSRAPHEGVPTTDDGATTSRTVRILALAATSTLIAAIVAAGVYYLRLPEDVRARFAAEGMPFAWLAAAGLAIQTESWRRLLTEGVWSTKPLIGATVGVVTSVVGGTLLREIRRTASIPLATLADAHAEASRVGGLGLFVLFLVGNTIVIYAAVSLVRRGLRPAK